jgi:hypothetical protein
MTTDGSKNGPKEDYSWRLGIAKVLFIACLIGGVYLLATSMVHSGFFTGK